MRETDEAGFDGGWGTTVGLIEAACVIPEATGRRNSAVGPLRALLIAGGAAATAGAGWEALATAGCWTDLPGRSPLAEGPLDCFRKAN